MAADVALNMERDGGLSVLPPVRPANVLVMPAFHSASIATKMLQELGGSTVIGPLLVGFDKPIQIVPLGAKDSDIVNMAAIAAFNGVQKGRRACPQAGADRPLCCGFRDVLAEAGDRS
jgi:malate dehydrogenase (oxaloacetate-decarboxylating)(NADP+)